MADDDDGDEAEPIVELGEGKRVEGMPLARVSSRQTWGVEKSRLVEREGDTEIRTPDGPQRLDDVLGSTDTVYFARRQDFEDEVTNVVGTGPVPTANDERERDTEDTDASGGGETESATDSSADSKSDVGSGSDSDADPDPDLDPDPDGDAEARATSQGEAHAETSTDSDSDTTTGDTDERDSEN